jgi:Raf kinase inhibitor-like YbhB/YbcL family protein
MEKQKEKMRSLTIRSLAFSHNGNIPSKYTCEGENCNPPVEITDTPPQSKSIALIMEDLDAPRGIFVHWLVWNLALTNLIMEKTNEGISGTNSFGKIGYGGPCPPSGTHRYFFRVYALDKTLDLEVGADKEALLGAMKDHIIAKGEIMGLYRKKNSSNL